MLDIVRGACLASIGCWGTTIMNLRNAIADYSGFLYNACNLWLLREVLRVLVNSNSKDLRVLRNYLASHTEFN